MKNFEGKVSVTFKVFCSLALIALMASDRSQFSSYVHCYMILCWNLFARSISISSCRTHHLSWQNDCLVVDMSVHKGDQTGEKITPKHVYANPFQPEICPILALALHIFSTSLRMDNDDSSLLFLGTPYELFTKWLHWALTLIPDLGFDIGDYGTHSFRKGVASYVASFINGPSIIAIFLRAGWSLGPVQDRYITYSDGGDQLCGRVCCGLNFTEGANFAVLPACFLTKDVLTSEEWEVVCPMYRRYSVGFQSTLPYLLAALVYHWPWIQANVSPNHPIFQSRLVRQQFIEKLTPVVIPPTTSSIDHPAGLTATGVPPHVDIQRQLAELKKINSQLNDTVANGTTTVMTQLPNLVTANILANINVTGAQQISRNDMESMLDGRFDRMNDRLNSLISGNAASEATSSVTANGTPNPFTSWTWNFAEHAVPFDWKLPRGTLKSISDLYFTGQPAFRVRPLKLIETSDVPVIAKTNFSKWRMVMKNLKLLAESNNLLPAGIDGTLIPFDDLTILQWDSVFVSLWDIILPLLQQSRVSQIRHPTELSYITFYEMFLDLAKSQRTPQQPASSIVV